MSQDKLKKKTNHKRKKKFKMNIKKRSLKKKMMIMTMTIKKISLKANIKEMLIQDQYDQQEG